MNITAIAYQYFTLREWKIINAALDDLKQKENYIVSDERIDEGELLMLRTKLPSASFDY